MYRPIHNNDGTLAHSNECKMSFGRKDKECPRCVELMNGASTRDGWQKKYFEKKKSSESLSTQRINNHECRHVVCTCFDH